jgi:hypothetical protein
MRVTPVAKTLDKKLTLIGFEVLDLLSIFIVLSTLNLFFGQTAFKIPLVWLPTIGLALILRYGKKGKPDKYLIHWLRYQVKPGVYSAFPKSSIRKAPKKIKKEKQK